MKPKTMFKDRYVLAEGYPWAMGLTPYTELQMRNTIFAGNPIDLEWPEELWKDSIPKYRLVLERVK